MARHKLKLIDVDRTMLDPANHVAGHAEKVPGFTCEYEIDIDGVKYTQKITWRRDSHIIMRFGDVPTEEQLLAPALRSLESLKQMHAMADALDAKKGTEIVKP